LKKKEFEKILIRINDNFIDFFLFSPSVFSLTADVVAVSRLVSSSFF